MLSTTTCSYRINVSFSNVTDFGSSIQYQVTLPFKSSNTIRQSGGLLHQVTGNSYYHVVGIVDTVTDTTKKALNLYYFASKKDLPWKSSKPVGATTITSHFDISGIYEIQP